MMNKSLLPTNKFKSRNNIAFELCCYKLLFKVVKFRKLFMLITLENGTINFSGILKAIKFIS